MVSPTSSVLFPFPREALTGSGTSYELWAGFVDDLGADAWVLGSGGVEVRALMRVLRLPFLALSLISGHDYHVTQNFNVRKNCLADKP